MSKNKSVQAPHQEVEVAVQKIKTNLDVEQYKLFKKIADLRDLEDWELALSYIQAGLEGDMNVAVRDLLSIDDESIDAIIEGIAE
jgi:hypothetical protein